MTNKASRQHGILFCAKISARYLSLTFGTRVVQTTYVDTFGAFTLIEDEEKNGFNERL